MIWRPFAITVFIFIQIELIFINYKNYAKLCKNCIYLNQKSNHLYFCKNESVVEWNICQIYTCLSTKVGYERYVLIIKYSGPQFKKPEKLFKSKINKQIDIFRTSYV